MGRTRRHAATAAVVVAVGVVALAGCGSGGEPAVERTVTVTAETGVPQDCLRALDAADQLGGSYAEYMALMGEAFTAVSKLDAATLEGQSAKIKAHQEAAVQLSRQYASARDACKAHDRAVTE